MFASDADLQTNIFKVLAAGGAPMTPAAIARALPMGGRPTPRALKSLLKLMVKDGRLSRAAGLTERYAAAPGGPAAALVPAAAATLASVGAQVDQLMAALAARGLPRAGIKAAILRHLGAAAGDSAPAQAPASHADAIIDAMHRLEPRVNEGAAVSIARLRDALSPRLDKAPFDATLLALLTRGVVELQSHAWPARLTAEDKALLIDNGQGGWFDSAALLRRSA